MPSYRSSYVERVCKACEKGFLAKRSEVKRHRANYCSRSCLYKAQTQTPFRQLMLHTPEPNEHGCLLWTGLLHNGYGLIQHKPKDKTPQIILAHRFVFELAYGPIHPSHRVLHDCDQFYPRGDSTSKRCVNPLHLKLGTQTENMADKVAKGRQTRGEECNLHKLTEEDVLNIRLWYGEGLLSQLQLAKFFHVSLGNISAIVNGHTWKHLL